MLLYYPCPRRRRPHDHRHADAEHAESFLFTGEVNEYFFDNQMLSYMIKNRCNEHIALITQDKNLMGDIILMNRMSSFTGNDVNVYTLNNKGHIITIV